MYSCVFYIVYTPAKSVLQLLIFVHFLVRDMLLSSVRWFSFIAVCGVHLTSSSALAMIYE